MLIPVGNCDRRLTVIGKTDGGISQRIAFPLRFVRVPGEATR